MQAHREYFLNYPAPKYLRKRDFQLLRICWFCDNYRREQMTYMYSFIKEIPEIT